MANKAKPLRFIVTGALLVGPALHGCDEPVEPNEPYEVHEGRGELPEETPNEVPEEAEVPATETAPSTTDGLDTEDLIEPSTPMRRRRPVPNLPAMADEPIAIPE